MSAKSGKTIGRKQVNRAIEGSEALMQAIFDNALDGILLADIESRRFVAGNNMICRMLGYSPDELKELTVADIHPPEDLQHVLEQFEQQTQREITLAENVPVKRKDGSVFFADINASPVEQHGRKLMAGFFRDITER
ncbi:MAG: PAS domain S-box protein, partial [Mariprofundaceae bacterium]